MPWIRLYSSNTETHFLAQYCCAKKGACVLFLIARSRCKVSLGVHRSCRNDGNASRPVMKTFPVREGDYLHYRPECIFSTYLARRWEFVIGSFSLWWKHFLHETGTVFITGWKSSLRCSWERDPWSRKQAGRHPPHEEKPGLVRIDRLGANKSGFPQEEEVYLAHSYCKSEVWSGRHDALLGFQPHLNVDLGLSRSNRIHLPVHATGSWILLKSNGWIEI